MSHKRICAYLLTLMLLLTNTVSVQWNNGELEVVENPNVITASANNTVMVDGVEITIRGTFGNGFQWGTSADNTVLYVSGTGEMPSFTEAEPAPWYVADQTWEDGTKSPYKTIIVAGAVTSIGDYAFRHCVSMTSIELPDTVTRIGNYAFDGCYSWKEVDLTGITSIGTKAFAGCGFEYVHITESVAEMGVQVFYDCGSVQAYSVSTGSALYFADEQGALFNNQTKTMLAYPRGTDHVDTYTMPEGITSLEEMVFVWADIDTVVFPSTLTYFSTGCCWLNKFTSLTIPNSVTAIGQNAFASSGNLTSVIIPGNVKKIEQNAFANISTLTTVVLEDGVEWLHDYSFANNANLASITIPASVTIISQDAFAGSNANMVIKGYANSPAELFADERGFTFESLGEAALETIASGNCGATEADSVEWTLYSNGELRISGTGAMEDYGDHSNQSISAPWFWASDGTDSNRMKIAKVVIEDGVTRIGSFAFDYCEALSSVEYADSVTSIGASAFKDTRWAAPLVKKNVTELGSGAFHIPAEFLKNLVVEEGNTSFVIYEGGLYDADKTVLHKWGLGEYATMSEYTVVLPSTLKTIGVDAFCGSMVSAINLNEGLETIEERGIYNAHFIETLHLPSTLTTLGNNALAYIDNLTGFTVARGNTAFWADERGALFSADKKILYYYPRNTRESFYIIPDGVEIIKWHAWTFNYLKGLLIPASVKTIEATPMYVYNPNNLDNRHILLYGYAGSVAEQYAKEHTYVTYAATGEVIEKGHEFLIIPTKHYKRLKIHCPVDVYVYDTNGTLVASVVNEEVLVYEETIYADDMAKTVYLDNGIDYRIEIKATGEGTVSYGIEEVTENADGSEITNIVEFNDIPIVENDTITSAISMLADAEEYVVSKNEGSIEADKVEVDGVTTTVTPTPEVTPDPTPEVTPTPTPGYSGGGSGSSGGGSWYPPVYVPTATPTPVPTAIPTPEPTVTPTAAPTDVPATPTPTPEGYYDPEISWTAQEVYEEESKQYDIFIGTSKKDTPLGRTLEVGEKIDLNFYGVKNWSKDAYTYKWTSSDESIATVDKNGVVTMLAEGVAIIKLELVKKDTGEVMKVAPVEVGVPAAEYDILLGTSKKDTDLRRSLEIDKSIDLNFYGVKNWKKDNFEYEWYSTDESVATVEKNGLVTAHSAGKVVIRLKLKDLRTGEYLVVAPVVVVVSEQVEDKVTE